jgi:hypothetical protein
MVRDANVDATASAVTTVPAGGKRSLTKQERKDLRKAKAAPSTRKLKKIYEEQGVPGAEDEEDGKDEEDGEDEKSESDIGLHEQQSDDDEEDDSDEDEGEEEAEGRSSAGGRRQPEKANRGALRAQKGQRSRDVGVVGRARRDGAAPTTSSKAEKRKRIKKQKKAAKAAAAASFGDTVASK